METFSLPANDERFLRLTTSEALEQVLLIAAARSWRAKQKRRAGNGKYDDTIPFEPDAEITTGSDAEAVADTPLLTGDVENDRIELAETADDGKDWRAEYAQFMEGRRP